MPEIWLMFERCDLLILLRIWYEKRYTTTFFWCRSNVTYWSYLVYDDTGLGDWVCQNFATYWSYLVYDTELCIRERCDLLILLGIWPPYCVCQNVVTYWSYLDLIWEKKCRLLIFLGIWPPDCVCQNVVTYWSYLVYEIRIDLTCGGAVRRLPERVVSAAAGRYLNMEIKIQLKKISTSNYFFYKATQQK